MKHKPIRRISRKSAGQLNDSPPPRTIIYVSGTRADFGLMQRTLLAVKSHPRLRLRVVATGTHLDNSRGATLGELVSAGLLPDAVIDWKDTGTPTSVASATFRLSSALLPLLRKWRADGLLVLGDRVEAFAAAAAAHLAGLLIAHVHGGDRAQGQADDTLRHVISKLAHLHFPATGQSASRLIKLGEERRRVLIAGAPGCEAIRQQAASTSIVRKVLGDVSRAAVLSLHPVTPHAAIESLGTQAVIRGTLAGGVTRIIALMPNADPGAAGIVRALQADKRVELHAHVPRTIFLGLLRDAAILVGNSSAGIVEAGSFGIPVVDIGPRQLGREHGHNVHHVGYRATQIQRAVARLLGKRYRTTSPYDRPGTAALITNTLANEDCWTWPRHKVITY